MLRWSGLSDPALFSLLLYSSHTGVAW